MNPLPNTNCSARYELINGSNNGNSEYHYVHDSCSCRECLAYRNSPRNYKFESADESAFAYRSFAFDRVLYRDDRYGVQVTPIGVHVPHHFIDIDDIDEIMEVAWPPKYTRWWTKLLLKAKFLVKTNLLITLKDGHGVRRIRAENTATFKRAVAKAQSIVY